MSAFLGLSKEEMQLFLDEMTEHLDVLEAELLVIEESGVDNERIGRLFRAAHTIKGAAAMVGLDEMAALTHAMESIFDRMRTQCLAPKADTVTLLLQAVDYLRQALLNLSRQTLPQPVAPKLLLELNNAAEEEDASFSEANVIPIQVHFTSDCQLPAVRSLQILLAIKNLGEVITVEPSEVDIRAGNVQSSLTLQIQTTNTEEMIRSTIEHVGDVDEVIISGASTKTNVPDDSSLVEADNQNTTRNAEENSGIGDRTIRVDVELLDDLMNLVGELVIDRGRLGGIGQSLAQHQEMQNLGDDLGQVTAHLARVTGSLQEKVLKARMLPIRVVFRKFPRMMRDLAQQIGKQIDFRMIGEDTELDRSLLEVISDPLMHLLRNALDHGLESTQQRIQAGKPETGVIQLSANYEENQIAILIHDDGKGMDPEALRQIAVKKGVLSAERARELSDQDAMQLIFAPGFSTANKITDISGRGVGLDVVRRNIEQVGGRIEVESQIGFGSTFRLLLPLTLATIQALLVQVDDEIMALPLSTTKEVLYVDPNELTLVGARWVTRVRGSVVPLLWLKQFSRPKYRAKHGTKQLLAVLVNYKGDLIGFVVDRLIGEQEVVVKGLGEFFGQIRGVSGVTILGDGNLALIIDTVGLADMLLEDGYNATHINS